MTLDDKIDERIAELKALADRFKARGWIDRGDAPPKEEARFKALEDEIRELSIERFGFLPYAAAWCDVCAKDPDPELRARAEELDAALAKYHTEGTNDD
jgi:hypothetical protein